MKVFLVSFCLMSAFSCALQAQAISGDWSGTLSAGGAQLHLALHINKAPDGELTGSLDSPDQGASFPLSSVSLKDSKVTFGVDAIHGSYEGRVTPEGAITGSWTQGQTFPLDFKRGRLPAKAEVKPAPASDIDGTWMGTLDTGAIKLRLVFHFRNTADGLSATADSPDQGATGMTVDSVTRKGTSLKLEMKKIGGAFDGTLDKNLESITGSWSQGGGSMPLVLKRVKDQAQLERRRPQNPVKPYPYGAEEVTFQNPAADISLAATFTIPPGKGPFPAVILITGSGPQDRDENLMGHKPFLVLADYLTRRGIAVLRADDRGVAKSGGDFANATTADFATDTEAALAYLKTRPEADAHKLGLIGHSEGGIIAPMLAARHPDVAFIVMLAGPGVPGDQILLEQSRLMLRSSGVSAAEVDKKMATDREIFDLIKSQTDQIALEKVLRDQLAKVVPAAQMEAKVKALTSPWFRYFLAYDPAVALRHVTCAVLALNGEKDLQVSPQQNIPVIKEVLLDGGNKHFEVAEMKGLNHLFQAAQTGAPSEYGEIEETFSPIALEKIITWIRAL